MSISSSNGEDTTSSFFGFMKQSDHFCYQVSLQSDQSRRVSVLSADTHSRSLDHVGGVGDHVLVSGVAQCRNNNNVYSKIESNLTNTTAIKDTIDVLSLLLSEVALDAQDTFYFVFDVDEDSGPSNKNRARSICHSNGSDLDGTHNDNVNSYNPADLLSSTVNDVSIRKVSMDSQSSTENQSIFGSPLKLQAIADLSAVNGHLTLTPSKVENCGNSLKLQGLPIDQARNILKKFCLHNSKTNNKECLKVKAIVILCDGLDRKRTLLLGAHQGSHGSDDKTSLRTFCSTLKSSEKMKLSSPSLQPLQRLHKDYKMSAYYTLLLKGDSSGFMSLQAQWTDQLGLPRISNLHSAKFSLKLAIVSGHKDSGPIMYKYFKELEEVKHLYSALKNGEVPCIDKKPDCDAMQNLQQLFTRIKKGEESGLMSMNYAHGKRINLSPQRDSDFTDKIWVILQQCSSYDEMLKCLGFTLAALKKREMSVYVHKDNQTILAQLVRQSSIGMASFPPLIGNLPLKMIVEIGLEKIKRDYCAILTESGLCSGQDLDKFVKECQTDVQNESIIYDVENINESQIEMIRKLHHCLELVSLMDSFSEHLSMRPLVNLVLKQYKTQKLDEYQTFIVPVLTKEAVLQINNVPASMIRRECECGTDCFVDCYLSELPECLVFPISLPSSNPCDVSSSVLGESKEFYVFQTKETVKVIGGTSAM